MTSIWSGALKPSPWHLATKTWLTTKTISTWLLLPPQPLLAYFWQLSPSSLCTRVCRTTWRFSRRSRRLSRTRSSSASCCPYSSSTSLSSPSKTTCAHFSRSIYPHPKPIHHWCFIISLLQMIVRSQGKRKRITMRILKRPKRKDIPLSNLQ